MKKNDVRIPREYPRNLEPKYRKNNDVQKAHNN